MPVSEKSTFFHSENHCEQLKLKNVTSLLNLLNVFTDLMYLKASSYYQLLI